MEQKVVAFCWCFRARRKAELPAQGLDGWIYRPRVLEIYVVNGRNESMHSEYGSATRLRRRQPLTYREMECERAKNHRWSSIFLTEAQSI